ncbi:hypothetical protein A3F29_04385 [Candidatus Roizmanbacteria bacterium RIFCSPHIGHO2_12_FULL_33_9]|uniref:Uncharacterized protein n=1 Tax=Candidatus Roizmanbacteria bacterium RIFCSPHIGHO2_12_FULL_33_9 TaxID=1802045 RepID=A0A1F7HIS2_9BACT|nr:MAG: hypothetical protein A3F29_04385 [Candidatus Roizmanbacteria bacterium RIFCSPHIGHO2_12_FULL_33_9]
MDDLLQDFNIKRSKSAAKIDMKDLSKFESSIIEILKGDSMSTDEILDKHGKDLTLILQALTSLELKGYVVKNADGKYTIT